MSSFVTADVASLYSIIQHDDALLALNWALSQRDGTSGMAISFFHNKEELLWA